MVPARLSSAHWACCMLLCVAVVSSHVLAATGNAMASDGTAAASARFIWELYEPATATRPGPRNNAFTCYLPRAGLLVLFGGTLESTSSSVDDTWLYNVSSRTWTQASPPTVRPTGRNSGAYGYYEDDNGKEMCVIAHGTIRGSNTLADIWQFDWTTSTWEQLPNNGQAPPSRYSPAFDIYPGTHLFFMSHGFSKRRYSDTYYYDLRVRQWTRLHGETNPYNPSAPHARCLVPGAMPSATRLTLYGGCMQVGFTGGPCPARDSWSLNFQVAPATINNMGTMAARNSKWSSRASDGPSPRTRAAMARLPTAWGLNPEGVLLLGGEEKGKQTISVDRASNFDIDLLHTGTGKWFQAFAVPATPDGRMPVMRSGLNLAVDDQGGRIFMVGGTLQRGTKMDVDEVWVLTFTTDASGNTASLASAPGRVMPAGIRPRKEASSWFSYPHLHGLFMGLSWGILLPSGVIIARHLRHKDPLWFKLHRAIQATGTLFSVIGLVLVVAGGAVNPVFAHGIIGLIVVLLGILQPINAYYRPHKGMKWRRQWEWLHKGSGRLAVLLGLTNVSLGTFLVVGPTGLIIAWHVILGLMVVTAISLEVWLWVKRQRAAVEGSDIGPHVPMEVAAKQEMGMMGSAGGNVPLSPGGTPLPEGVSARVVLTHRGASSTTAADKLNSSFKQ